MSLNLLNVIDDAPGFLKATFQGPQGSGKTRSAVELALTVHKMFGSKKPLAFFDTETGSDYVAKLIADRSGMKPLRAKTRAFSDLMAVLAECVAGASDVLIVDSITHVWRELNDAYLGAVNKTRLAIDDIMAIKAKWYPWPDAFLNSPLHILVCGREGNEWGREENERGKYELVPVGKKMKVESEFGYEASLMVSMSAEQVPERTFSHKSGEKERRPRTIINVATVLKDRFDALNGERFEMPTGESFMPHLKLLNPQAHGRTDMAVKTGVGDVGDDGWAREKRNRVILCEEIQGEILRIYPGQSVKDKAMKAAIVERAFNTRSWTKVESVFDVATLKAGLATIRQMLADPQKLEQEVADEITGEATRRTAPVTEAEPAPSSNGNGNGKAAKVEPKPEPEPEPAPASQVKPVEIKADKPAPVEDFRAPVVDQASQLRERIDEISNAAGGERPIAASIGSADVLACRTFIGFQSALAALAESLKLKLPELKKWLDRKLTNAGAKRDPERLTTVDWRVMLLQEAREAAADRAEAEELATAAA